MEPQYDFLIRRDFLSLTAEKMAIHFRFRSKTYDETLGVLRRSLQAAKLGDFDKAEGLRRLDKLVRSLEKSNNPAANFDQVIKQEKSISALDRWSNCFGRSARFFPTKAVLMWRDKTIRATLFEHPIEEDRHD